jgi:hypothetical protein
MRVINKQKTIVDILTALGIDPSIPFTRITIDLHPSGDFPIVTLDRPIFKDEGAQAAAVFSRYCLVPKD